MRTGWTKIFFGISTLLLAAIACQVPLLPPPTFTPRPPEELTRISQLETRTAQAPTVPHGNPLSFTPPNALATETPAVLTAPAQSSVGATATPFIPPTDTLIPPTVIPPIDTLMPSPVIPLANVSKATNCRTGPSQYYKLVGTAAVGTKFTVVGKNTPTNYWVIQLADGRECWLWGQYATLEGNINSLPEYSPPAFGRIEGEVRMTSAVNAPKMSQAFVNIGMGFAADETGNDGVFFFEDVPAGNVIITATHSGFYIPAKPVFVSAGQVSVVIMIASPTIVLTPPTRVPSATPTRGPRCPIFQPNCLFFPTLAPPLP